MTREGGMPQYWLNYYRYWDSYNGGIIATMVAIIIRRNLSIGERRKDKRLGDFQCRDF